MTKKYVLTGGPGAGKSTLLRGLIGKRKYGIREAAEDYIKQRQSFGVTEPWKEPDFQESILELQVQRESGIPAGIARVFIDRGLPDGLAYVQPGTKTYERILEEAAKVHYEHIFLIEPLEKRTRQTEVRRENYDEAMALAGRLEVIYEQLGYEITRITPETVEERIATILPVAKEGGDADKKFRQKRRRRKMKTKVIEIPIFPKELEERIAQAISCGARAEAEFKTVINDSGKLAIEVWAVGYGDLDDGYAETYRLQAATLKFSPETGQFTVREYSYGCGEDIKNVVKQYYHSQDFTICPTCGSQIHKNQ